jgi:hypothetical protein
LLRNTLCRRCRWCRHPGTPHSRTLLKLDGCLGQRTSTSSSNGSRSRAGCCHSCLRRKLHPNRRRGQISATRQRRSRCTCLNPRRSPRDRRRCRTWSHRRRWCYWRSRN